MRTEGNKRYQNIVIHYRFLGVLDVPYVQKQSVIMETRKGVAIEYTAQQNGNNG